MVLDAMARAACPLIHNHLPQPPRGKAGEAYGRGRRGRWPLLPGDWLVRGAARAAARPWAHGLPQHPIRARISWKS
jgi:hypothetical protein